MLNKLVPLKECPIGLFIKDNTLCVKTEYGNEAYIVSSGECFWGGAKTREQIGDILVLPIPNRVVERLELEFSTKYKLRKPFIREGKK